MSMLTHAMAHAVLPGLVLAFLVAGETNIGFLMIGALVVGVITACAVQLLMHWTRVEQGAAIGVVFTALFAIGLILLRVFADKVHLHAETIIEGQLTLAATDQVTYFGIEMPRSAWLLAAVLMGNILVVMSFWKEIIAAIFDPDNAKLQGLKPQLLHQLVMVMTAVTTIAAFEAVGSILVVAMMVIPAATALLIAKRLTAIMCIAVGIGILASILGHILAVISPGPIATLFLNEKMAARVTDTSSAGMIAVVNGLILFAVAIMSYFWQKFRRKSMEVTS